jgi:uncharacterized membrane protein
MIEKALTAQSPLVSHQKSGPRRAWLEKTTQSSLPLAAMLSVGIFLCVPLPFEHKAHAFMHGLCAQRPSHSFHIAGHLLPFDARMTGIYAAYLTTILLLIALGRHRAPGLPAFRSGVVLFAYVLAMAIDGFNSLFDDLQRPALYHPNNWIRFGTGWATGVSIGVIMTMLLGMTLWTRPDAKSRVTSTIRLPLFLMALSLPFAALLTFDSRWIYYPVTLLLVTSAVMAFSGLSLITLVIAIRRDRTFDSFGDTQLQSTLAFLVAIVVIIGIGALRFIVEAATGAPPLV